MPDTVTDALLWAWCNLQSWSPDRNTMTEPEVEKYWTDYEDIVRRAIRERTGKEPDEALKASSDAA